MERIIRKNKYIYLLGGQPILFPTETLDKKEKLEDVYGYLENWADVVIARHEKRVSHGETKC